MVPKQQAADSWIHRPSIKSTKLYLSTIINQLSIMTQLSHHITFCSNIGCYYENWNTEYLNAVMSLYTLSRTKTISVCWRAQSRTSTLSQGNESLISLPNIIWSLLWAATTMYFPFSPFMSGCIVVIFVFLTNIIWVYWGQITCLVVYRTLNIL